MDKIVMTIMIAGNLRGISQRVRNIDVKMVVW